MKCYIYHHLGLGDHIICHALVRNISNQYDNIVLFVKQHNLTSVKFMYNDIENIDYVIGDDWFVNDYIKNNNISQLIKIGFDFLDVSVQSFDKSFYKQLNIDFEESYSNFIINRRIENEKKLYEKYNLSSDYIFVHDDKDRGYNIDVKSEYIIVRPNKNYTDNIFEYIYLMENAKEIHCIDSSFKLIADRIKTNGNCKLFFYKSIRPCGLYTSSKKSWSEK